jgi:hypothetical protein
LFRRIKAALFWAVSPLLSPRSPMNGNRSRPFRDDDDASVLNLDRVGDRIRHLWTRTADTSMASSPRATPRR